jgi:hypothetical protein
MRDLLEVEKDNVRWAQTGRVEAHDFVRSPERAFAEDRGAGVRSIRTDRHAEDAACGSHGEEWCLSRRELSPSKPRAK